LSGNRDTQEKERTQTVLLFFLFLVFSLLFGKHRQWSFPRYTQVALTNGTASFHRQWHRNQRNITPGSIKVAFPDQRTTWAQATFPLWHNKTSYSSTLLSLEEKNVNVTLFNAVRIGFITEISSTSPEGSGRAIGDR
jgi:hypothetical protein